MPAPWRSRGTGRFDPEELGTLGERVVFEEGALVFNPAYVHLGDDVYVGHRAMLKGDTRNTLIVGNGTWVGPNCYFDSVSQPENPALYVSFAGRSVVKISGL